MAGFTDDGSVGRTMFAEDAFYETIQICSYLTIRKINRFVIVQFCSNIISQSLLGQVFVESVHDFNSQRTYAFQKRRYSKFIFHPYVIHYCQYSVVCATPVPGIQHQAHWLARYYGGSCVVRPWCLWVHFSHFSTFVQADVKSFVHKYMLLGSLIHGSDPYHESALCHLGSKWGPFAN